MTPEEEPVQPERETRGEGGEPRGPGWSVGPGRRGSGGAVDEDPLSMGDTPMTPAPRGRCSGALARRVGALVTRSSRRGRLDDTPWMVARRVTVIRCGQVALDREEG